MYNISIFGNKNVNMLCFVLSMMILFSFEFIFLRFSFWSFSTNSESLLQCYADNFYKTVNCCPQTLLQWHGDSVLEKKIGWMCYRKQELFTLHEHLSSPYVFGGDHVNHLFFSFLFLYSLSSSCLVYSMLPVSLDCLRRVLCTQCCQCLWIVHSWLRLWFSVTLILVPR